MSRPDFKSYPLRDRFDNSNRERSEGILIEPILNVNGMMWRTVPHGQGVRTWSFTSNPISRLGALHLPVPCLPHFGGSGIWATAKLPPYFETLVWFAILIANWVILPVFLPSGLLAIRARVIAIFSLLNHTPRDGILIP